MLLSFAFSSYHSFLEFQADDCLLHSVQGNTQEGRLAQLVYRSFIFCNYVSFLWPPPLQCLLILVENMALQENGEDWLANDKKKKSALLDRALQIIWFSFLKVQYFVQ